MDTHDRSRIEHLDGLRGIAILLVVLFHAYARWPALVPYGGEFKDVAVAKYGWLGVELFFMISGFVIYMTLEKCDSFRSFALKRWLRLFPAMLLVSLLIFASAALFPERPAGRPVLSDLVPGLLLVEPSWIAALVHHRQGVLEGSYWSLFVEVKFYVLFGALYFACSRRIAKLGLLAAFLASIAAAEASRHLANVPWLHVADRIINDELSFTYAGWFLVGVLTYELRRGPSAWGLCVTLGTGVLAALYGAIDHPHDLTSLVGLVLVALFVGASHSSGLRRLLSTRALLFIGFISYPLYLLHENFMVATLVKLGKAAPQVPGVLLPIVPFAMACAIAFVIARYLEPALRRLLLASIGRLRRTPLPTT